MRTNTTGTNSRSGFTLLEVIIACAIFFIAGFAILELVTRSVSAARSLQQREPDAGMIAATLSLTNQLIEGSESGDFQDLCGDLYSDYSWGRDVYEVGSNGLFQVDFFVINDKRAGAEPVKMSILLYRPQSPPGSATRPR
jgi:Tfp pilus assembly protein PilV